MTISIYPKKNGLAARISWALANFLAVLAVVRSRNFWAYGSSAHGLHKSDSVEEKGVSRYVAATRTLRLGRIERSLREGLPTLDTEGVGDVGSDRCSGLDLAALDKGKGCGPPLSMPCFDHGRCEPNPDGTGPKVYVYDDDCSLSPSFEMEMSTVVENDRALTPVLRGVANQLGLLADSYESACIFIHVNIYSGRGSCALSSPLWNEGRNHLMIDLSDWSR